MNLYDVLAEAGKREGLSQNSIAERLGKSSSYIPSGRARNSSPRIDTATRLLRAANYRLYALPEDEEPPASAIEITAEPIDVTKDELIEAKAKKLEEQARKLREQIGD